MLQNNFYIPPILNKDKAVYIKLGREDGMLFGAS